MKEIYAVGMENYLAIYFNNANFYTTKNIISKFRITSESISGRQVYKID